jgi:hypothetical protein
MIRFTFFFFFFMTTNPNNLSLDPIGEKIVHWSTPYHKSDAYKENVAQRIQEFLDSGGADYDDNITPNDLLDLFTRPANKEEWEAIVESIEKESIVSFHDWGLSMESWTMFDSDAIYDWIVEGIQRIQESWWSQSLYLGSSKDLWLNNEWGWWWRNAVGPFSVKTFWWSTISLDLNTQELESFHSDPYKLFLRIDYAWEDQIETLSSELSPNSRQWRKKYLLSFVVEENIHKHPWKQLVSDYINSRITMNQDEFLTWFARYGKNITLPKSLSPTTKAVQH